jgi:hypothetical protein
MAGFNWQCPFCARHTTITNGLSEGVHHITLDTKHGSRAVHTLAVACPNEECKELFLTAYITHFAWGANGRPEYGDTVSKWTLLPEAAVKPFPDYVPTPILSDYREACLIRDLSPKASATIARRCLQGMIRDFWKIKKDRLIDEIKALEGKVDAQTWGSIDAVRKLGNIGAHMEKDIDVIVDVDPGEASLLIELVEDLITDWYVNRHEREQRANRLVAAAAAKKEARNGGDASEGGKAEHGTQ